MLNLIPVAAALLSAFNTTSVKTLSPRSTNSTTAASAPTTVWHTSILGLPEESVGPSCTGLNCGGKPTNSSVLATSTLQPEVSTVVETEYTTVTVQGFDTSTNKSTEIGTEWATVFVPFPTTPSNATPMFSLATETTSTSQSQTSFVFPTPSLSIGNKFHYLGCFHDTSNKISSTDYHALYAIMFPFVTGLMTHQGCESMCHNTNQTDWTYFGLKNGNECWCGWRIHDEAHRVDHSECNEPCIGNPNQSCGGNTTMLIFKNETRSGKPYPAEPPSPTNSTKSSNDSPLSFSIGLVIYLPALVGFLCVNYAFLGPSWIV
ncbi:WSC-domain-containing protein [Polyplosphaeria fusca]|uniref:WSC-domain-containing protein n=1 Tax=Polyplosphaeria fusca TaxID=682080 RepID=A0A9P4V295_9PLEO|nr:WSC-domain-containing protein [Polyplosphaeria fusca]